MSDDLDATSAPEGSHQEPAQSDDSARRAQRPGMSPETLQAAMRVMGRLAGETRRATGADGHA